MWAWGHVSPRPLLSSVRSSAYYLSASHGHVKGFSPGVEGCGLSLDALCGSSTQGPPPHSTGVKSFYSSYFPFLFNKKGGRSSWCYHQHFLIYLLLKKETAHLRRDDSDSSSKVKWTITSCSGTCWIIPSQLCFFSLQSSTVTITKTFQWGGGLVLCYEPAVVTSFSLIPETSRMTHPRVVFTGM